MRKFIKIILIGFLTFNLSLTSFASDAQPGAENPDSKPATKIIPIESVEPVKEAQAPASRPNEKKEEAKGNEAKAGDTKKEEPKIPRNENPDKTSNTNDNTEDSSPKENREAKNKPEANPGEKDKAPEKAKDPEMERLEKAVDDLVTKLDKNSNLTKALAEMQSSMNTEKKASVQSKDVSKKTEEVIKDYNQKIQTATTANERRKLENEAADKIKSINNTALPNKSDSGDELGGDIPKKQKKILLEVKPDRDEDEDRNQILALNPSNDGKEDEKFFLENPIVIITLIFILALVVAIGIVIRKNDKKEQLK